MLRVIQQLCGYKIMNRRTIHYAMVGCIVALSAAVVYAMIKLFVLSQRVDASILVINVVAFAGLSGFMIYLAKKDRDLQEKDLFRD
ncbi:MAG TPA: hypothetical protein VI338_06260 [Nitrososphaera sp.]|nr:hypothetical protein [Nitrososphaera sp.]